MCIISSLITLVALAIIMFSYYIENYCDLKAKQYDLDTVTVGDYSVEMDISDKQYQSYKNQYEQNEINFGGKDLTNE